MNLLVPTDFSTIADYAFETACQIAKKTNSHIHIYHCASIPEGWEDLSLNEKLSDHESKNITIGARHKLIALQDIARHKGVSSTIHLKSGNFLNNIDSLLKEIPIDLIVMGSHGKSGKAQWYIGSNTQKTIRKIKTNALIIKSAQESFQLNKVAFVSSLNTEEQAAFKSFLEFVKIFDPAEVHVLSIDTSSWFSQPSIIMLEALRDFKKIADEYKCETHFFKDYSVQSGIRHFIEEHNIDLVGISYLSRNPIKRIFLGSNVEMLVNHSDSPVLCINN